MNKFKEYLNCVFIINKERADNHLTDLSNYIDRLHKDNEQMRKKIIEWNKDDEIVKLKNEIRELQSKNYFKSDYSISEEELAECRKWET